jgi:hypothetical protein
LAKMRYATKYARSSVERVHVSATWEGPRTLPESCVAVGGVVSAGLRHGEALAAHADGVGDAPGVAPARLIVNGLRRMSTAGLRLSQLEEI